MKELLSRYVWIVDMLNSYGRLSRSELNDIWMRSSLSEGNPMPERTFYHYRRGIEESLNITIACDRNGRYYIDDDEHNNPYIINWLVEAYSVNSAIKDYAVPTDRVSIEEVPSAREFLPMVLSAISNHRAIKFTYAGFSRPQPDKDIIYHPYFVKRYKQRWYMVGARAKDNSIRTYALDRVREMTALVEEFEMPDLRPGDLFDNLIGVTVSKGEVRTVRLMTTPTQAKYFRALPFHRSQTEVIHDDYSIFTYRLQVNYELVHEILSYGRNVKVLTPRELVTLVSDELRDAAALYDSDAPIGSKS